MDPTRTDSTLSLSPQPKLHGERRCESALFDLRNVIELQTAQGDAMTKRAPASTGFVDVKALLGIDRNACARPIVPPSRGLVTVPPPRTEAFAVPERDASTRRAMWALCLGMFAVLVAMAIKVLG